MPTLKQLTCRLEIGPKNIQLTEYGTSYHDGVVSTHVAVPSQAENFSIHLVSSGYIAPGLAMFVFIDGVSQCNRNRRGLVLPEKETDKSLFEVDFRVRQKEEKFDDKIFIGREWKFETLQTTTADEAPMLSDDVLQNVGTIEVVVLRCHDDTTGRKPAARSAIDDGRGMNLDGTSDLCNVHERAMPFGLDGAADGWPVSPPADVKFKMFSEAEDAKEAAKEAAKGGQAGDKDGGLDDRGRDPLAGLGKAFEKQGYKGYEEPKNYSRHPDINHGPAPDPWLLGNPYLTGFGGYQGYQTLPMHGYGQGYEQMHDNVPRAHAHGHRKQPSNATDPSYKKFDWTKLRGFYEENHDNSVKSKSKASSRKSDNGANDDNNWNNNDQNDDNNKNDGPGWGGGDGANETSAPWGNNQSNNNDSSGNNWDNSNQANQNQQNSWDNSDQKNQNQGNSWDNSNSNNQNGDSWDNAGKGNSANDAKETKRNKSKKHGKKSRSSSPHSGQPKSDLPAKAVDPDKPHIKHYWANWAGKSTSASGNDKSSRDVYVVPEEPLFIVPAKFAEEHNLKHQVHAGKGKMYQHSTARPKYIDTMTTPYAVFVFKYRSKETLEGMFADTDIKEDREPYRERIKGLTREEVVEELIRAKKAAGYNTDSDVDPSTNSSSSESSSDNGGGKQSPAAVNNNWNQQQSDKKGKGRDTDKKKTETGDGEQWAAKPAAATNATGKGESWEQTAVEPIGGW